MTRIVLSREDFNNPLYPRFWEELCDQLDLGPEDDCGRYPDTIELKVKSAQPLLID